MGVVDDNRKLRRDRNHLNPALDPPGPGQSGGQVLQRRLQGQPAGQHTQGVIHTEASGNGQAHAGNLPPRHRLKLHPFRKEPQVFGRQIRPILVFRIGNLGTGHRFMEIPPRLIVQVKHRRTALPEEQALGIPVGLHGSVEIQVVLGQVGKNARSKWNAVQPVEDQGV